MGFLCYLSGIMLTLSFMAGWCAVKHFLYAFLGEYDVVC